MKDDSLQSHILLAKRVLEPDYNVLNELLKNGQAKHHNPFASNFQNF
jgi:hypothetical protein